MKYAIYGINRVARDFLYIFDWLDVVCFLEEKPQNKTFCGREVYDIDTKLGIGEIYDQIIVCEKNKTKKLKKLEEIGLKYGQDYILERDFFESLDNGIIYNEDNKPVVVWGIGQNVKHFIDWNDRWEIEFYIDNYQKERNFKGKPVYRLDEVADLQNYFVVIAIANSAEMEKELTNRGMIKGKDYCKSDELRRLPSWALEKTIFDEAYYDIDCRTMFHHIELLVRGEVQCCCHPFMNCTLGNVNEEDIDDIWHSNMHKIMCLSVENKTYSFCKKDMCPMFYGKKCYDVGENKGQEYQKMPEYPDTAILAFDASCNLKCISCRSKMQVAQGEELQEIRHYSEMFQKKILPHLDFMILAGAGEVFFSQTYKEIYHNANTKKIKWIRLLTNGIYFNEKNWKDFTSNKTGKIFMTVSIDAATKETYEKLRGNGKFEILQKNMQFAAQLRKEGKLSYLRFNFVVQKENYLEMERFVEWGLELCVDEVFFTKIVNWGTYSKEEFREISMMEEDGITPKKELAEILKKPIMHNSIVDLGTIQYEHCEAPRQIENYYKWELERKVSDLFSEGSSEEI